jgi:CBS-domain-containing membrane protein
MELTVKDVMTTRVVSVKRDTSFRSMAAALRDCRVSAFPVLDDDGKVIGLVSEADMLAKEALDSEPHGMPGMIAGLLRRKEYEKARGTTAGDLMSRPPIVVAPDDTLERAARLMYTRKVKRLPVVDESGQLVGIIGRSDLLAVFDRSDEEILKAITDDIVLNQFLADPNALHVTVENGVVTLSGVLETSSVGHEIVDQARHAQGVVAVRDRLSYPPESPGGFDILARFPVD